jgi:hypothetical protein
MAGKHQVRRIPAALLLSGALLTAATACGSAGAGSSSSTGTSAAPSTVTATVTQPATSATSTTSTTSPQPSPPPSTAQQNAPMIVVAYFDAINAHDYQAAWDLGGKNLGGSYAAFAAGFADTVSDTVHIVDNTETTVRITLDALQTDGSVKSFTGTYTVRGGEIVGASLYQVGS